MADSVKLPTQPDGPRHTYTSEPNGLFTWNATVRKGSELYATLSFRNFRDSGALTMQATRAEHVVVKRKSTWALLPAGSDAKDASVAPLASATRVFRCALELDVDGQRFAFFRTAFFQAEYAVRRIGVDVVFAKGMKEEDAGGERVGSLRRESFFKRNLSATFDNDVPEMLPAFALWLLSIFDRQEASAGGAGAAAGAGAF